MRIALLSILLLVGCSQKNAHRLTATEEFDLRGKCAELGSKMEQADEDLRAKHSADTADTWLTDTWSTDWASEYNVTQNRCYVAHRIVSRTDTKMKEMVLSDAQTQQTLALAADWGQKKSGFIRHGWASFYTDDVGYDAAKKFIDERMNGDEK